MAEAVDAVAEDAPEEEVVAMVEDGALVVAKVAEVKEMAHEDRMKIILLKQRTQITIQTIIV
eukprot:14478138-Ditylum_brightwellii.AAC.1